MLEEMMNSRLSDLRVAETTIEHRITWERFVQVENLERALKAARGKLAHLPTLSAKAN